MYNTIKCPLNITQ